MTQLDSLVAASATALEKLNAMDSPRLALRGRVVTMNDKRDVIEDGVVVLRNGVIEEVRAFKNGEDAIDTKGTIYPGLLDLHNHLVYNCVPIWDAPKKYDNRKEWQANSDYRASVTGPAGVVAGNAKTVPSVVRYVETKVLLGGVTSVQGMKSSYPTTQPFFTGVVRNFEVTGDNNLPTARTRIPDLKPGDSADHEKFRNEMAKGPYFFHLCEGIDDATHALFVDFVDAKLLGKNLIGIHCLALTSANYTTFIDAKCHNVWSPLSNQLLYGKTVDTAILKNLPFAIGCDWTPSGSKNPLEEIKVARLTAGVAITDEQLVAAITRNAAAAVQWDKFLGTLEPGKYADVLVVDTIKSDPYENLVAATEKHVRLVVIAGYPRYGDAALIGSAASETLDVGGRQKALALGDPDSPLKIKFADAQKMLRDALAHPAQAKSEALAFAAAAPPAMQLLLDNEETPMTATEALLAAIPPKPTELDAPTATGDAKHFDLIDKLSPNLKGLRGYYA